MRYQFNKVESFNYTGRSEFANSVCKVLVEKHEGDFIKAIKELEPIYLNFFEFVRNIYELVDTEIPLFCLYELLKEDKETTIKEHDFKGDNLDYDKVIISVTKACIEYYINN